MPLFDRNSTEPVVKPGTEPTPPKSTLKLLLKIVWYVVLGVFIIGALGIASHGDLSGLWVVALFGLPTLWLIKGLETRIKLIATGVFGFVVICFVIFSSTPSGKAANANFNKQEAHEEQVATQKADAERQAENDADAKRQAQEDKEAAQQKALEAKQQEKQDAEQAKQAKAQKAHDAANEMRQAQEASSPVTPLTETPNAEQQIKSLMKARFGGRLRYVTVDSREDGGYGVFVAFDIGNNLTTGIAKASIEDDMKKAYKDLYTSSFDVHIAHMTAYGTTQDKFGHNSEENVYATYMMRDIGRQIEWNNYLSLNFSDLWTIDIINPSFQQ